jgi:hypothetical protein
MKSRWGRMIALRSRFLRIGFIAHTNCAQFNLARGKRFVGVAHPKSVNNSQFPDEDVRVMIKTIQNNAIKFYEYFNAMKFSELDHLISKDSRLKDAKKGNFSGSEQVIARLIRVRTKHGEDPWVIGDSDVLVDVPAVRTRIQFVNNDTHTIVTIVTTLTFDEDHKIAMIYTDRIAEEPI